MWRWDNDSFTVKDICPKSGMLQSTDLVQMPKTHNKNMDVFQHKQHMKQVVSTELISFNVYHNMRMNELFIIFPSGSLFFDCALTLCSCQLFLFLKSSACAAHTLTGCDLAAVTVCQNWFPLTHFFCDHCKPFTEVHAYMACWFHPVTVLQVGKRPVCMVACKLPQTHIRFYYYIKIIIRLNFIQNLN